MNSIPFTLNSRFIRGFIAAIFVIPLFITSWTLFPSQFGTWMMVSALLFVLLLLIARALIAGRQIAVVTNPLLLSIALYVLVRVLAGVFGIDPFKSFWGNALRFTGTWLWILMTVAAFALAAWAHDRSRRTYVLWIATLATSVTALLGWLVQFAPSTFNVDIGIIGSEGRFIGLSGNATYFAASVMVGVFFGLALTWYETVKARRVIAAILTAFLIGTMLYAKTRATIIGMSAGLVVAALVYVWNYRVVAVRWVVIGIMVLGALVVSFRVLAPSLSFRGFSLSSTVKNIVESRGAPTRFYFWHVAWQGFLERPVLGWGPESYDFVFDRHYPPELLRYSLYETWGERPHNIVLEHLSNEGVVGTLAFLAVFVVLLVRALRMKDANREDRVLAASIVGLWFGYGAYGVFTFDTPTVLLYLFAGAALFSSLAPNPRMIAVRLPKFVQVIGLLLVGVSAVVGGLIVFVAPLVESAHAVTYEVAFFSRENPSAAAETLTNAFASPSIFYLDTLEVLADDFINNNDSSEQSKAISARVVPVYVDAFDKALTVHPESFGLQLRYAQILGIGAQKIDKTTYYDRALAAYDRARTLSPHRQVIDISEAELLITFNDVTALDALTKRLASAGDNAALTKWLLSLASYAKGDIAGAGHAYAEALGQGFSVPRTQQSVDFAVMVLEKNNDYFHIAAVLKAATTPSSEGPALASGINFLHLAYALGNLRQYQESRAAASHALELDPSLDVPVRAFLVQLSQLEQGKLPQ